MKIRGTLFALLIILALLTAQYGLAAGPSQQSAATATPLPTPAGGQTEAAAQAVVEPGQAFQVAVATYLMDTAGLHEIDERLNGEGLIEPGDAGVVNRVNSLLTVTAWPEELQAQVGLLKETLNQYAEALANDDLEAAKPLSTQVHDQQHDLSHAIEGWQSSMSGSAGHEASEHAADEGEIDEHAEEHDESEEGGD